MAFYIKLYVMLRSECEIRLSLSFFFLFCCRWFFCTFILLSLFSQRRSVYFLISHLFFSTSLVSLFLISILFLHRHWSFVRFNSRCVVISFSFFFFVSSSLRLPFLLINTYISLSIFVYQSFCFLFWLLTLLLVCVFLAFRFQFYLF